MFQDKQLTKEEVVNKYDLFVGSQATDFGDALSRHDEFWSLLCLVYHNSGYL